MKTKPIFWGRRSGGTQFNEEPHLNATHPLFYHLTLFGLSSKFNPRILPRQYFTAESYLDNTQLVNESMNSGLTI